jgi:hypothetical protein
MHMIFCQTTSKAYRGEKVIKAGKLQIVCEGKEIVCDLVLMSEWREVFHARIAKGARSLSDLLGHAVIYRHELVFILKQ